MRSTLKRPERRVVTVIDLLCRLRWSARLRRCSELRLHEKRLSQQPQLGVYV